MPSLQSTNIIGYVVSREMNSYRSSCAEVTTTIYYGCALFDTTIRDFLVGIKCNVHISISLLRFS